MEIDMYSKKLSIKRDTLTLAHDFEGAKQISDVLATLHALALAGDFEGGKQLMVSTPVLKLSP
jgi:hypothetical protein